MSLEIDHVRRLVCHRRSSQAYESLAALRASLAELNAQMQSLQRADYCLLQDVREARGRNDDAFESVMARERPRMSGGFRKVAILVATQIGKLQVQRYVDRVDALPARVFLDETEAEQWLLAP